MSLFYPSIYTHSLPWAVHGKDVVKQAMRVRHGLNNLWSNKFDVLLRNLNEQQTVGIPIGPDISRVVSEIILGAVDVELHRTLRNLRGIRYIDDYEFSVDSESEADRIVSTLQTILGTYELDLNLNKTEVVKLPTELERWWVSELRTYVFRNAGATGQKNDLVDYFNRSFRFSKEMPAEGVLKYAIARLNGLDVEEGNWSLYESLLAQCAIVEPACLNQVMEQLLHYRGEGCQCGDGITARFRLSAYVSSLALSNNSKVA